MKFEIWKYFYGASSFNFGWVDAEGQGWSLNWITQPQVLEAQSFSVVPIQHFFLFMGIFSFLHFPQFLSQWGKKKAHLYLLSSKNKKKATQQTKQCLKTKDREKCGIRKRVWTNSKIQSLYLKEIEDIYWFRIGMDKQK